MNLRQLSDALVARADQMPGESDCARHMREAASSLLDADMTGEREGVFTPAPFVFTPRFTPSPDTEG